MSSKRTPWPALLTVGCLLLAMSGQNPGVDTSTVRVWEEDVVIPTYRAGAAEPNPMFYFGRVSQGARGKIYPYPLYDSLTGHKADKTYRMVYLENEYIRIGILPEIGGRIFEGVDKTNGYDFIYRQHVIKPALIGLIGAWISGGVEWNIPHHHRATTFLPVQYRIENHPDGSKTVWVGELEIRHRMRWAVGYTLRPGKSYLEASLRIVNRTPVVETMLCFANVAVHATPGYQVIYPPDTEYVTHHAKRQFTTWPIAKGSYGGADFGQGVDVSWYKDHLSANSMFAWNYWDDFFAGYDHGKEAGIMSIANHHIVPGKKLWTWGNGPRGRMWDKILTDDDGPYIELMVGAYSDNQPDYSWLQPFETKSFSMYWYPFRGIGGVKKANLDAAVNLQVPDDGPTRIGFCTTSAHPAATVRLTDGDRVLLERTVVIDPAHPFVEEVALPEHPNKSALRASLTVDGKELVSYSPEPRRGDPMPEAVSEPPAPEQIRTNEELYLTGRRIEQFHNARLDPEAYWREGLRRDPGDVRINTALGIRYFKEARYQEAETLFRKALERLTARYTTPEDARPLYYLGLTLKAQGRLDEAFDELYLATWSAAWRSPAYFALAQIAAGRGESSRALDLVDRSLEANALNLRALNLKAGILRHLGRFDEAVRLLETSVHDVDPLDARALAERWLISGKSVERKALIDTMQKHPVTAEETAAEYLSAGLWQDGARVLGELVRDQSEGSSVSPMVLYYLGYFEDRLGDRGRAGELYHRASRLSPEYVFPFEPEAIPVLRRAMHANPQDARAPYYLGNLLFDWQPDEAVSLWEHSVVLDPTYPVVHRNLAVAWSHRPAGNDLQKAIDQLEQAVSLPEKYALHFVELDELYEAVGAPLQQRLHLLEANHEVVAKRDDGVVREIALEVAAGKYDDGIRLMTGRRFNLWEGGTLDVAGSWTDAHLCRGQRRLESGQAEEALADFRAAGEIPENLPSEDRGTGRRLAELDYWIGTALEKAGKTEEARRVWQEAIANLESGVRRHADRRSGSGGMQGFYEGAILQKLGRADEAKALFQGLLKSASESIKNNPLNEDGGPSATDLGAQRNRLASAHYLAGLAHQGLAETARAKAEFRKALNVDPGLVGAYLRD